MPGTGGRLGWKLPAPAATTTTGAMISVPASVFSFQRPSASFSSAVAISPKWNCGVERLDLLQQPVGQLLAGDDGQARNVVDRLFRIKLGALPARPVEDVDQMAFEIEQPQLEHREQADGAGADDGDIGFDRRAHRLFHSPILYE